MWSRTEGGDDSPAIRVMTDQVMSRPRRRGAVSLSSPQLGTEPVGQLDRAVEILHRVTRELPERALSREELIALGGLLTQLSGALVTLTDMLIAPAHHHDRIRTMTDGTDCTVTERPTATALLRDCRNSYHAACLSARAFHSGIRK